MSIASYAVPPIAAPPIVIYNTSIAQDPNTHQLDSDSALTGAFLCFSCVASAVGFVWACYDAPRCTPLCLACFFITAPQGGKFCLQTSQNACKIFRETLAGNPNLPTSARAMM